MDEGKLEITLLKEILQRKGFKNEGIIAAGEVGLDSAVIDVEKAKKKAQDFYKDYSDILLVVKSDPITFPTEEPGRHAVIINANDIACAGGVPFGFLSTIIIPPKYNFEDIKQIQEQIHLQCLDMGISVLGGHTEISSSVNVPIVSGHMFGFVPKNYFVENSLKEGDMLISIGSVGSEGTGIIINKAGDLIKEVLNEKEVTEGITIGNQLSVSRIALDINRKYRPSLIHDATEGGYYGALSEIITFKKVGIKLLKKPSISSVTTKLSEWLKINPLRLISSGLLIMAFNKEKIEEVEEYLNSIEIKYSIIGVVTKEEGILRFQDEIIEKPQSDEIIKALHQLERINKE